MRAVILSVAKDRLVRAGRSLVLLGMTTLLLPLALSAQDTTQGYPWRLSYFPYITASPNDGVMAMARAVWFRQSRSDDRVSIHDQVAVEGGYSTNDAWLLRARGDFPRIANGWRLQIIGQVGREANYIGAVRATRQAASVDLSRNVTPSVWFSVRGEAVHLRVSEFVETEVRGRIGLIIDRRDREYDPRRGTLVQGGVLFGKADDKYLGAGLDGSDFDRPRDAYTGWYGLASAWISVHEGFRITARVGAREMSESATLSKDAMRIIPAWEDAFVVFGGPESNRALPIGASRGPGLLMASAELRHDVITFPGGAIALIGFVDAGRVFNDDGCVTVALLAAANRCDPDFRLTLTGWTVGPGGGVALRLLRNAVLTATVARAEGATRIYVSSGWSW